MVLIADFVGGFLATWLLTSLFNWLLRRWISSINLRLLAAAVLSLAFATIVAGYGFAREGEPPVFSAAFVRYVVPQVVVLILLVALARRRGKAA